MIGDELKIQVEASPYDPDLRAVYADWLEENGDADGARHQRNAACLIRNDVHHIRVSDLERTAAELAGYGGTRFAWGTRLETPTAGPLGFGVWDGEGNRTDCYVLDAEGEETSWPLESDTGSPMPGRPMPRGYVFVVHSRYGTGESLEFYGHPDTLAALLPPGTNLDLPRLSWVERVVLVATRCLKSSYGGDKEYRKHEARRITGIPPEAWEMAKAALISRRLLTASGAISPAGRSAVGWADLYQLAKEQHRS